MNERLIDMDAECIARKKKVALIAMIAFAQIKLHLRASEN